MSAIPDISEVRIRKRGNIHFNERKMAFTVFSREISRVLDHLEIHYNTKSAEARAHIHNYLLQINDLPPPPRTPDEEDHLKFCQSETRKWNHYYAIYMRNELRIAKLRLQVQQALAESLYPLFDIPVHVPAVGRNQMGSRVRLRREFGVITCDGNDYIYRPYISHGHADGDVPYEAPIAVSNNIQNV